MNDPTLNLAPGSRFILLHHKTIHVLPNIHLLHYIRKTSFSIHSLGGFSTPFSLSLVFYTTLSLKSLFIDCLHLWIIQKTLSLSLSLFLDFLHDSFPLQLFDFGLIVVLRQPVPPVLQGLSDHGEDVGVVVLGPALVPLHDQVVLPTPRGAGTTEPPPDLSLIIS